MYWQLRQLKWMVRYLFERQQLWRNLHWYRSNIQIKVIQSPNDLWPIMFVRNPNFENILYYFRSVWLVIFNFDYCSFLQVLSWFIFVVHHFCSIFKYGKILLIICTILYYLAFWTCVKCIFFSTLTQILCALRSSNKIGDSRHFPPPTAPQEKMVALPIQWLILSVPPPCTFFVRSIRPIWSILVSQFLPYHPEPQKHNFYKRTGIIIPLPNLKIPKSYYQYIIWYCLYLWPPPSIPFPYLVLTIISSEGTSKSNLSHTSRHRKIQFQFLWVNHTI